MAERRGQAIQAEQVFNMVETVLFWMKMHPERISWRSKQETAISRTEDQSDTIVKSDVVGFMIEPGHIYKFSKSEGL